MAITLKRLARTVAIISALLGSLLFIRPKALRGYALVLPKLLAGALAPFLGVAGAIGSAFGLLFESPITVIAGGLGALASYLYVQRVTTPHGSFRRAFGRDWQEKIRPEQREHMLNQRWTWQMQGDPQPRRKKDIAFWTLQGTNRKLLCDIWQPAAAICPSGLAIIYLHGSAWHLSDKDVGTRPFFQHLTAQGHVVMDVAYRLYPETNLCGMAGDVKRAIAWMKQNAASYGANPDRIILAGGSAGGHLALLAAYTPQHPVLTPDDLQGVDLSVHAVVSYYGPADLTACYEHTSRNGAEHNINERSVNRVVVKSNVGKVLKALMGSSYERFGLGAVTDSHLFAHLLGGTPSEVPEQYALFSPLTHVQRQCPPTLLIHGSDDSLTPASATQRLYRRLLRARVPAVSITLPQTEHAFDLLLPRYSPPAQAAFYDTDRFLALMT